ncbi:hypothetical protein M8J76_010714 [Diaphorina citri]|nr:hypothetical protein M8J76_010714 [Diaphorina citri]
MKAFILGSFPLILVLGLSWCPFISAVLGSLFGSSSRFGGGSVVHRTSLSFTSPDLMNNPDTLLGPGNPAYIKQVLNGQSSCGSQATGTAGRDWSGLGRRLPQATVKIDK